MHKRLSELAAAALLLMMFCLAGGAALRESVTIDEVAHIGAGLSYVQKLDLRLNDEHPPLAKVLTGVSLSMAGTRADYSSPQWLISRNFLPAYMGQWIFGDWVIGRWNEPRRTLLWARLPMLLLTILLGWVLFHLGQRLGGNLGGLLCLAVYSTMPAFLAFGPLVLTDVIIALFAILTLWTAGSLWRNPDAGNTRRFALALAGALLSKFSSGIVVIAIVAFVLSTRWWALADQPLDKAAARPWRKLRWKALRKGTVLAAGMVYVVYFILSWNQPMAIPGFADHGWPVAFAGRLLMPAWLFLRGLGWVLLGAVRPSFLLGHPYPHGVWFYFPVLLVLKSLPGFMGLLLLAALLALWHWRKARQIAVVPGELITQWRAVWVSLLVFMGICLISTMDISIRHFSIPLVLLTLILAPVPRLMARSTPAVKWTAAVAAGIMAASCLFTAVRVYPYYMPYVSPAGMGRPLYWLVSDSNADWDHALPEVEQFAREHGLENVPLDDYGFVDATIFAPHTSLWDCQAPAVSDGGRWVVISANMILDSHNCEWVLRYPRQPLAGGSMYAVRLPSPIPPAGAPGGPPLPSARRNFLNMPIDLRTTARELVNHPERTQRAIDEMTVAWKKQMAEAQRKKQATSR
jgi:hypothetical protein